MIRCRRHHLEARCRERGYTWSQVQACIASADGDALVVDETHPAYPHAKRGLGDMVADGLAAVGITKKRVQAMAAKVGVKDCGCRKRQAAMNAWANKYLGLPPGRQS